MWSCNCEKKHHNYSKTDEDTIRKNCIAITGCEVANARKVTVIKKWSLRLKNVKV